MESEPANYEPSQEEEHSSDEYSDDSKDDECKYEEVKKPQEARRSSVYSEFEFGSNLSFKAPADKSTGENDESYVLSFSMSAKFNEPDPSVNDLESSLVEVIQDSEDSQESEQDEEEVKGNASVEHDAVAYPVRDVVKRSVGCQTDQEPRQSKKTIATLTENDLGEASDKSSCQPTAPNLKHKSQAAIEQDQTDGSQVETQGQKVMAEWQRAYQ